jgi:hypothetical protein
MFTLLIQGCCHYWSLAYRAEARLVQLIGGYTLGRNGVNRNIRVLAAILDGGPEVGT